MTAAKCVTALLAFAVGMSIVSQGMAQTPVAVPKNPPQIAPKKVTVTPTLPAKPAVRTAQKPTGKPAVASRNLKVPAGMQVNAPKSAQQVAARQGTGGPAVRTAYSGRAMNARAPATLRGTRYGAVPVMPSLYAPPQEKLPPPPDDGSPRTLSFHSVNTQESITVTYWRNGRYVQSELDRLNGFLRDSRDGDLVQMDPQLFDVLWHVQRNLGTDAPYQVLSAYRSPQTNAWLASSRRGVAWDSLHMRGQAIDVKLPGRSAYQIRQTARALGLGGVGYYPRSGFVHIDTGPVRYW
jgi:uncharacterized protein YcbK (DUF882 family)